MQMCTATVRANLGIFEYFLSINVCVHGQISAENDIILLRKIKLAQEEVLSKFCECEQQGRFLQKGAIF